MHGETEVILTVKEIVWARFSPSGLTVSASRAQVMLWERDPGTGQYARRLTLDDHQAAVNVVEFDDNFIVSASGDRSIRVWRTTTGEAHRVLRGHHRGARVPSPCPPDESGCLPRVVPDAASALTSCSALYQSSV